MKKAFPYIIIILSLFALFVLIFTNEEKKSTKIITIDTLHSYLYNNEQLIEIPIYTTNDKIIKELDAYEQTYLYNNNNKKLIIDLVDITFSHHEKFIDESYSKYILKFRMPNLTENFSIENAYLKIIFINNDEYSFKIGNIYLNYIDNNAFNGWQSIDSKRNNDSLNSVQMDVIEIEFEEIPNNIKKIQIEPNNTLKYAFNNNKLSITVPNYNMLINNVPLWIELASGEYITFNNHYYIIDYDTLEKAGKLLNLYVLD